MTRAKKKIWILKKQAVNLKFQKHHHQRTGYKYLKKIHEKHEGESK